MNKTNKLVQTPELAIEIDTESTIKLRIKGFIAQQRENQFSKQTSILPDRNGHLTFRSQAKRLLARVEKFKVVILDFEHIEKVGQAFSDEVFRVFKNRHPDIRLFAVNTNEEIDSMILRAGGKRGETIR